MAKANKEYHQRMQQEAERFLKSTPPFQKVVEDGDYIYTYNPETGWWEGVHKKTGEASPYRMKFN